MINVAENFFCINGSVWLVQPFVLGLSRVQAAAKNNFAGVNSAQQDAKGLVAVQSVVAAGKAVFHVVATGLPNRLIMADPA